MPIWSNMRCPIRCRSSMKPAQSRDASDKFRVCAINHQLNTFCRKGSSPSGPRSSRATGLPPGHLCKIHSVEIISWLLPAALLEKRSNQEKTDLT